MSDKCADMVADILVHNIIFRFGMPTVIHSDQGEKLQNNLMNTFCTLMGSHKTRTSPNHPESDGMVE